MTQNITLETVIMKLPQKFRPEQASDLNAIFQFSFDDAEAFYLAIKDQSCTSHIGQHEDPDITIITNEETFLRVICGEQDGMSAFMKGQLRAEGNVMLATRLGKLFSR